MKRRNDRSKCLPSYNELLDFRLPHEQDEDDEALKAVEKITDVENVSVLKDPRDWLHAPCSAHYNEQAKVKEKSKTAID